MDMDIQKFVENNFDLIKRQIFEVWRKYYTMNCSIIETQEHYPILEIYNGQPLLSPTPICIPIFTRQIFLKIADRASNEETDILKRVIMKFDCAGETLHVILIYDIFVKNIVKFIFVRIIG